VGDVSANTRQTSLSGNIVFEQDEQTPTDPYARSLYEAGVLSDGRVSSPDAARFALATERYDTPRVLAWIRRAAAEGVLVEEGADR
jgi:hypothetical protein